MRDWGTDRVARAAGARTIAPALGPGGPSRVVIDSREVRSGDLFVGLAGSSFDGGRFTTNALEAGAWGVLVRPDFAQGAKGGAVLVAADPLVALQSLAKIWRRELGARVVGITGSAGKTSTKDILAALLSRELATVASPGNLNTEVGAPLAILGAPAGTRALVLELAMRGAGQIAELAAICEPDVGIIVNIGPAHLEQLGSLEAIAAAKSEMLAAMAAGGTAVIPSDEPLLDPHLPERLRVITFGPGGDVSVVRADSGGVQIDALGEVVSLEPGFRSAHLLQDLCAAVAAARALDVAVSGEYDVPFSGLRGERVELAGGVTIVNDCYNANPMSMRAALEDLASFTPAVRRVAVLGDMLELGGEHEADYHRALGDQATDARVLLLVTVGPLAALAGETFIGGEHIHAENASQAAHLLEPRLQRGDVVLVKGSRGVGLEDVALEIAAGRMGA
ncbi:MAG: UDP-N-acetylmuramoyl-tripeptide--D-alanyl-D-alanine ligase [Solirubrobacteraceae bacterium]